MKKIQILALLYYVCLCLFVTIRLEIKRREVRQLKKDNKSLLEEPCPEEITSEEMLSDFKQNLSTWYYDSIPILYPGINSMGGRR